MSKPASPDIAARDAEIYRDYAMGRDSMRKVAARWGLSQGRVAAIILIERRRRAVAGQVPLEARVLDPAPRPPTRFDLWPRAPSIRLMPTRVVGMTPFGPDVEAADPVRAAAEAAPLWGGRYPRRPSVARSAMSSPAGMCVEG